jgi:hypothetical protein
MVWTKKNGLIWAGALVVLLSLAGCAKVSFFKLNGANLHPDVKTLSVALFFNDVGAGPPALSQNFTERLRDYFIRNTNLDLIDRNGDLQFEGSITGYDVTMQAPTGDELAGLQRLTVTVQCQYTNLKDDQFDFDQSFSFFADFPPDQNIQDVEDQLLEEILEQIVIDIFNASVANW